jgi:hypothetical protein
MVNQLLPDWPPKFSEPPSYFVRACADNDLVEVVHRIQSREDLNQVDTAERDFSVAGDRIFPSYNNFVKHGKISTNRQSGLNVAMQAHNLPLLRMLAGAGADLYSIPKGGFLSPLDSAISNNFPDGLRVLRDEFGYQLRQKNEFP